MDETRDGKSAVFVSREIDVLDSKIFFGTYLLTEELRNEGCCCCFWARLRSPPAGRSSVRLGTLAPIGRHFAYFWLYSQFEIIVNIQ